MDTAQSATEVPHVLQGRWFELRAPHPDDSCCVCHPEWFTIPLVWQIGCPTTGLPPAQPWHPSKGKVR
ncbi:MAG: hypothetical protein ACRD0V_07270 [Acidimicrobiales bacterium]